MRVGDGAQSDRKGKCMIAANSARIQETLSHRSLVKRGILANSTDYLLLLDVALLLLT
jgi:hypothetical protein